MLDASAPGERVALLVGNGRYASVPPLRGPRYDVDILAAALADAGFEVIVARDLDQVATFRAIRDFEARLADAEVGLFYYSGHGLRVGGSNYLVPVDAVLARREDVEAEAVDFRKVLSAMDRSPTQLNLFVVDACRNDPWSGTWFAEDRALAQPKGLGDLPLPSGFLLAYATSPGDTAADTAGEQAGAYALALARELRVPGQGLYDLFGEVHAAVRDATRGDQLPWTSVSMERGEFYFTPPLPVAPKGGTLTVMAAPGSLVLLDGEALGKADVTGRLEVEGLAAGTYEVWVAGSQFEVQIDEGGRSFLRFEQAILERVVPAPRTPAPEEPPPAEDLDAGLPRVLEQAADEPPFREPWRLPRPVPAFAGAGIAAAGGISALVGVLVEQELRAETGAGGFLSGEDAAAIARTSNVLYVLGYGAGAVGVGLGVWGLVPNPRGLALAARW